MPKITDEVLSRACEHCGKRFYWHRHGQVLARKYCSPCCKEDAYRVRRGYAGKVGVQGAGVTEVPARGVQAPTASAPPSDAGFKVNPRSAFERLQGDAVLSDWKPTVTFETDIPDIPEFLRRR
jgi:hypothetical protein